MKTIETLDRALSIAAARGVKTNAKTLKGVLRALRGTKTSPRKPYKIAPNRQEVSVSTLVAGFDQGRARTRLIDAHRPLADAISAALGADRIGSIGNMPNSYRGSAEESCSSATRQGDAILISYGRLIMGHASNGAGSRDLIPSGAQFVRRSKIMEAIRLPAGYRWGTDGNGAYIYGGGIADYHPTPAELAAAISNADFSSIISAGHALAAKRAYNALDQKGKSRIDRAARLLARIGDIAVTRADSYEAGNCQEGTDSFCHQNGIAANAVSSKKLLELAPGNPRVIAAIYTAARRAVNHAG